MDHTIKIRIRGAEFEATGSAEAVNAQYATFMQAVASLPAAAVDGQEPSGATPKVSTNGFDTERSDEPIEALSQRAFESKDGLVSLNALPQGDEDQRELRAVMLLLYANKTLGGQGTVNVDGLLKGLRQSGMAVKTQLSKVLAPHTTLITKTGVKRGTRYGLTNKGTKEAEEVLRHLF